MIGKSKLIQNNCFERLLTVFKHEETQRKRVNIMPFN